MIDFLRPAAAFFAKLMWAALMVGLLYELTAPPLMMVMTRQNPREWPRIYEPLVPGFQCQWTRPFFSWYFDSLWRADTEMRGG